MLQAQAVLEDGSGNVIATADNPNTLGQTISTTVSAGTYYLVVESAEFSTGVSVGQGYSIGQYSISGTIAAASSTPTFSISGSSTVNEQSAYTLSLSATDPGQTVSSWTLNWGDGDIQTITGNPNSVTHTYADGPSNYTITATATDGTGTYNAGNTVSVAVAHVAPTVTLSGAANVSEGSLYTLGLSGVDDAGHAIASWLINWGDGSTSNITGNPSSATHTYAVGPNTYTITALATDDVSAYGSANNVIVTVNHVAPTLAISGASTVNEGSAYTLGLSASDPNHTISSWLITWGDGSISNVSGNPSAVTHTYATGPHNYTITATATDDVSTYAVDNSITVAVAHVPPTLTLSGASSVNEGSVYTLGLSANDPNHTISSWLITWGDGSTSNVSGNPSSATHTYATGPHNYNITATATDDVGTYNTGNSIAVSVAHVAPTLTLSGPSTVNEGSAYTLGLSASDPNHTISSWLITWGDGSTSNVGGNASSATHTYATGPHNYNITATATDDVGTYNTGNSIAVSVAHVAPTLTLSGASNVNELSAYTLGLSSSDPNHTISSWLITWGDGTTSNVSGNPTSTSHTYSTGPRTYTITATATDDVSTYNAGNSVAVTVAHVAPTLTLSGATTVNEGSTYILGLAASDPNHTISSWHVTWGDGSTSNLSGNPSSVTHTYATGPHNYTITATATDDVSTYNAGNSITVAVAHVAPTLTLSGASTVNEGSAYTLGLSSSDPNHTISSWLINWGDGSTSNVAGNPSSASHTYATGPHSYTITATATDDVSTYSAGNSINVTVAHVAPILTLSGASTVSEGSVYTLGLSASDPNHTISSWLITWGDGSTSNVAGNPSSVSHTYTTGPNVFTISATATDDVSTYAAANSITVGVGRTAPTLSISGANSVNEGTAYTLALSASDPGHTISSWLVNWGDGSVSDVTGNPSSVTHTYATGPNTYTVTATATDDVGTYSAGNAVVVSVAHVAPTLTLSGASTVDEGSVYTLGLSSSDPNHTISSWLITWGDGSTSNVSGNPSSTSHTYATGPHNYTITATATDDVGTYNAGNSIAVAVAQVVPTFTISGASVVDEGSLYNLGLSASDPGHTISSWLITWGDGSTSNVAGSPSSVSHTYATGPNDYTITATATDDVSTYSATNTVSVAVAHVAPTLTISGPTAGIAGSAYTLALSASDPNHTISSWLISWGDGTSSSVPGNPSTVSHTYTAGANDYMVTATATDDVGTYTAANSVAVVVSNPPTSLLTISSTQPVVTPSGAGFSLTFSNPAGIDAQTAEQTSVVVAGPAGFQQTAQVLSTSNVTATSVTVEFGVTAPGGAWSWNNNGTYTISAIPTSDTTSATPAINATFSINVPAVNVAGHTLKTAKNLGRVVGGFNQSLVDTVTASALGDYYRIQLTTKEGVFCNVSGIIDDVSLRILNSAGRALTTLNAASGGNIAYTELLNAGIYYVQVVPNGTHGTEYEMGLSTVVAPADHAGNTTAKARNLGTISSKTNITVSDSVNPFDTVDVYSLTIGKGANASVQLSGLAPGVSVQVLNSQGAVVNVYQPDSQGLLSFATPTTAGRYYLQLTSSATAWANYTVHIGGNVAEAKKKPARPAGIDTSVFGGQKIALTSN
jgi:hypothetical protein